MSVAEIDLAEYVVWYEHTSPSCTMQPLALISVIVLYCSGLESWMWLRRGILNLRYRG